MTRPLIAVTGASGAIGTELVKLLRAGDYRVLALSRQRPDSLAADVEWRPFSLSDPAERTAETLRGVDQLVHLAAVIPGKMAGEEGELGFWTDNVLGTQRLIEAMLLAKTRRLVLTGTANVYEPEQAEAAEDSPFGPQSRVLYLASKAAQEWLAGSMCKAGGIEYGIFRISSVIGDGRSIIDRLAQELAAGRPVRIDDGAAFGADFIDCDDVCRGLMLAIELELGGVYNLSSGKRSELLDAVLELAKRLGCPPDAIAMVHADRPPDTGFPAINCDRLRSFGFAPRSLSEVLDRIAERARSQAAAV